MKTKHSECDWCGVHFSYTTTGGRPRTRCNEHRGLNHPAKRRYYHLKTAYGVDQAWYDQKLEEQNHSCYICKRPHTEGRYGQLYVDHDHQTGKARGLLCQDCNHGLGKFFDNVEYLEKAITYLREHSE